MTKLHELAALGQSVWFDFIRRSLLTSGEMERLVAMGVRGVTSNPAIFEKAIAGSEDYDEALRALAMEGRSVEAIYEALAIEDIRRAADVLRPVYEASGGVDGYVSLEVAPALAHDTARTVAEARRLFRAVGRPNVMIKVPATEEGLPAITALLGEGVNVNVTLIFSPAQYAAVVEAYLAGLEALAASGGELHSVASVASFFVSRIDTAVDRLLEAIGAAELQGRTALAVAKVAYRRFRELFRGERWARLAAQGARVQRLLWASTSTKNPAYADTLYVDNLIGPDTVNTLPPVTLEAFLDHGTVALTVGAGVDEAEAHLARLAELGIEMEAVYRRLLDEGVRKFSEAFDRLLASVARKRATVLAEARLSTHLGAYGEVVAVARAVLETERVLPRIWAHDHTVWKPEPTEITNRLGWLHIAGTMVERLPEIASLVEAVRAEGYTHALLLGMGGSSLAPEVFRRVFGVRAGYLDLAVLDSTDPGAVLAMEHRSDPRRTLYVVATKSGGTVETLSFFRYFYNRTLKAVGADEVGRHFVAITDAGSHLDELAQAHHFRAVFRNDPNIGGRYSALSYFGLVPAALVGVDVARLLRRAIAVAEGCATRACPANVMAAELGAAMGALAGEGRDKVTFVLSPSLVPFGGWAEQLIAESTGKEGKGILPVVGERLGAPPVYGADRLFVAMGLAGEAVDEAALSALGEAGYPVMRLALDDRYALGEQYFVWELATAIAGYHLGINPFDQPDVEAAKALAREMVVAYRETGRLPEGEVAPLEAESLWQFLAQGRPGDYVALQAYVAPTPEVDAALGVLRHRIRERLHLATTVGYGPRYLHSTGQLHKGDAGRGLFVQFTADAPHDLFIPDEAGSPQASITFQTLKMAQALGDQQALLARGRRVIRFHLGMDVVAGLRRLAG